MRQVLMMMAAGCLVLMIPETITTAQTVGYMILYTVLVEFVVGFMSGLLKERRKSNDERKTTA